MIQFSTLLKGLCHLIWSTSDSGEIESRDGTSFRDENVGLSSV